MNTDFFSSLNKDELANINQQLLQAVLDTISDGIQLLRAIRDEGGNIVDLEYIKVNEANKLYTPGISLEGKTWLSQYPGDKEGFRKLVQVVQTSIAAESTQTFAVNGTLHWFKIKQTKFGDGVLLSRQDITTLKQAEEQQKESSYFIRRIADTIPDILFIMDLNTRSLLYSNRSLAADLGYSEMQIKNMSHPLFDIMHEEDTPLMLAHFEKMKLIADNAVLEIEYRMINADGKLSWFIDRNAVFKRDNTGIPIEKTGITQNITERKVQGQQLQTSLNLLEQAEKLSLMGSWEYDIPTGEFKWSEGMYRLFNIKHQEVTPEIYFDYTPEGEKDIADKLVKSIRKDHTSFEGTLTLLPPGKGKRVIKIKAGAIKNNGGGPVKVIGVDIDITEQLKAAEQINELNNTIIIKNRELTTLNSELQTFNSIATNDYKETLRKLYTSMEFIISHDARNLSNEGRANVRRAQSAIQRMKLLTEDIVTYSGIHSLETERAVIHLSETLAVIQKELSKKIDLENIGIECGDNITLHGYPVLISLLFHHLIDNSIKFRKEKSKLSIHISCSQQPGSQIRHPAALPDTPYEIITVSDNGIGFGQQYAESIFTMFYRIPETNKLKGSGIGLAICRKILDIHGGFITAESTPGNGATFHCYFPAGKK
jgi:PAS domain S-box-containing protein